LAKAKSEHTVYFSHRLLFVKLKFSVYYFLPGGVGMPRVEEDSRRLRTKRKGTRMEKTKERILLSAARLFQTMGFATLTVDDLAEAAGVGRTTFYKYFKGKADILKEMAGRISSQLETAILPVRSFKNKAIAERSVLANMYRVVDVFETSLPLFKVLFSGGKMTAGLEQDIVDALEKKFVMTIRDALDQARKVHLVRAIDFEVAALAIWGSFHAAILKPLAKGLIDPEEARRRMPCLVDYHVLGLAGT
jgi:AcrR family transcriptional regulator